VSVELRPAPAPHPTVPRRSPAPLAASTPIAWEAAGTQSFRVIAGGATIAGLALSLGAGHLTVGALAALPFFARLVHLALPGLTARWGAPAVLAWAAWCERAGVAAVAGLALLLPPHALVWLLVAFAVAMAGQQLYDGAMTALMNERVPRAEHGRFGARRARAGGMAGVAAGLLGGFILTAWQATGAPAPVVRGAALGIGLAASLAGLWALRSLRALPLIAPPAIGRQTGRGAVVAARRWWTSSAERPVVAFGAAWGLAIGLTSQHTDACAVRVLGFPPGSTTWLNGLWVGMAVLGAVTWGRLSDRYGGKGVLRVATLALAFDPVWSLLGVLVHPGFLVAGYATYGIANSGYSISLGPALLGRGTAVADRMRPVALFSAAFGIAAGFGPLVGGAVLEAGSSFGPRVAYAALFALTAVARLTARRLATRLPAAEATCPRHVSRVVWRATAARMHGHVRGTRRAALVAVHAGITTSPTALRAAARRHLAPLLRRPAARPAPARRAA